MEMKKVKFSLTKYTKRGPYRFNGYGKIDNENLYIGNKVYEDCIRHCHKLIDKTDEYKGSFYQFETVEFENDRGQLVELELEANYDLWFRILT